ncbi:MAG: succinyl-coa synthetase subunit alpha-like protein [Promethearchaeota archaeon CR_4]|nr:MAG: succinyl-coa synthetase subunit alpha-like protein [Candidatus Lokiarchaeota archaeon CR_4]
MLGSKLNIGFSKVISIGNAIDLKPADYVEYLTDDPKTKIIALYIENLGRTPEEVKRFYESLMRAVRKKPVIFWRGGISKRGAVAAASHTGALMSDQTIIEAMIKQTGVIPVRSFEEFMDTLMAFQMMKVPKGRGIGLVSVSGGVSVTNSDLIAEMGMDIPALGVGTVEKIKQVNLVQSVGVSPQNPIDLGSSYFALAINEQTIFALANDPCIFAVIIEISTHFIYNVRVLALEEFPQLFFESMLKCIKEIRIKIKKPVMIALPEIYYEEETMNDRNVYLKRNIPVFPTVERAARALRNMVIYREFSESRQKTSVSK